MLTIQCRMSLEVCNYLPYLDAAAFRHPLYLQSFGWLSVVGLAFQVRFLKRCCDICGLFWKPLGVLQDFSARCVASCAVLNWLLRLC